MVAVLGGNNKSTRKTSTLGTNSLAHAPTMPEVHNPDLTDDRSIASGESHEGGRGKTRKSRDSFTKLDGDAGMSKSETPQTSVA